MVKTFFALTVPLIALCLSSGNAQASFVFQDPPIGTTSFLVQGATPARFAYNATTEIFTATAQWGSGAAVKPPFDILIHDIVATFSMTATVNNAGEALGGGFSLTGDSLSLGISSPETLLSGKILEVGSPGLGVTDFLAQVATIDPALRGLLGSPGYAVLDFVSLRDDFSSSFSGLTATEAPVIYLVPEPDTGFIFLSGLALIWVLRFRRQ